MNDWETVTEEIEQKDGFMLIESCQRMRVPNGWLVKAISMIGTRGFVGGDIEMGSPSLIFMKDIHHKWEI